MSSVRAVLLIVMCFFLGCREPYVIESIASHAALSANWSEFRPVHVLRWSEPEEEISFRIDTPYRIGAQLEIIGPEGERCVPEVELVANDGTTFLMDTHGFLAEEIFFTFKSRPSALTSIAAIRVRSSIPTTISNVVWRGYNPKDVKR